jgi:hypothetical protein
LTRQTVAQQHPPEDLDLESFPTAHQDGYLYRAHSAGLGPWFFSSSEDGRFNLSDPYGTCYFAETVSAAVRERLGLQFTAGRPIAPEDAEKMSVSKLLIQVDRVADLESRDVADYPITLELTSMEDYRVSRAWARSFHSAGTRGIHYRGRFSYVLGDSWALFGAAGPDESADTDPAPVDGFQACEQAGIRVLPAPPADLVGLTIDRP